MTLPVLKLPESLNYIAVFLTLDCNLKCAYCINGEDLAQDRRPFGRPETTLTPEQWVRGLARIPYRADLPITLQGGEPTVYRGGRGCVDWVQGCKVVVTNDSLRTHIAIGLGKKVIAVEHVATTVERILRCPVDTSHDAGARP